MTDTNFTLSRDADLEDLPRTLRREHEARARMRETSASPSSLSARDYSEQADDGSPAVPAIVTRFEVPFLRLVAFFLKAVLAAIPALILLTAILWFAGQALQAFFPELVKMKILISFPSGR